MIRQLADHFSEAASLQRWQLNDSAQHLDLAAHNIIPIKIGPDRKTCPAR